jgi:hypothetical protein
VLVKYRDMETSEMISATHDCSPTEILRLVKEVDTIKLEDDYYTYVSSEFVPSTDECILDVLNIYVDVIDA